MKKYAKRYCVSSSILIIMTSLFTNVGWAEEKKIETSTQTFELLLGATRVIYNLDSNGATLSVENKQDYPVLIRSKVFLEDKEKLAPFAISPPLFRLEGQQKNRLRIVHTGEKNVEDRETLYWLCVTGIPPKEDDAWAENMNKKEINKQSALVNVKVSISNCIKLMVRPSGLKRDTSDIASSLLWKKEGNNLTVNNPTPFYINFSSLKVDGVEIKDAEHVSPFMTKRFSLPKDSPSIVQWQVINDFGGKSKKYQSNLR
ncbi:fimbria/pilus periplasmic chaperone [Serratia sp. N21D137]|uniref:fimbria/pilus periplasmic chaperone n=1 Tax=Serratia sp. N21D137 TaxID=3397495 RepID=UPI0039E05AA8